MNSASEEKQSAADQRVDQMIGQLLRAGVILSLAIVLFGAVLYLMHHAWGRADYRTFRGEPEGLRTLTGVFKGAIELQPVAVIQLGLLVLIATPISRVAFTIFAFAFERDWIYVAVTIVVLSLLIYSLTRSLGSG